MAKDGKVGVGSIELTLQSPIDPREKKRKSKKRFSVSDSWMVLEIRKRDERSMIAAMTCDLSLQCNERRSGGGRADLM